MAENLLNIRNLKVEFTTPTSVVHAVKGINLSIARGERVGIVGESGSGKSMTGRSILGLIDKPGKVSADELSFEGTELLNLGEAQMRGLRGKRIAMIMQDPKYSLNPVMTVGKQLTEAFRTADRGLSRKDAGKKAIDALNAVRIHDPERVFSAWPHELSGGMGQRVMIAMMVALGPDLLIADEPTSALDVTVQMQVLSILDELVKVGNMGLMFISHDLELVSSFCDRVVVMYSGRVMEECAADRLREAKHPYTRGLLDAMPDIKRKRDALPVLARDPAWMEAQR